MSHDYFKNQKPAVIPATHKVLHEKPMPKPAPKPGYKKAAAPGPTTTVDE